jgi:hypothetical protein
MPKFIFACEKCGAHFDSEDRAILCENNHPCAELFEIREMKFSSKINLSMPDRIELHFKGFGNRLPDAVWYIKK